MSGVTDPYELYKYVHPAEVGTSLGSGMGGMHSLQAMFKDRREEKDVQKDILQETYVLYRDIMLTIVSSTLLLDGSIYSSCLLPVQSRSPSEPVPPPCNPSKSPATRSSLVKPRS